MRDTHFAIPDGEYVGDLFFITDTGNKILMVFMWMGNRWMHEHEVLDIEVTDRKTDTPSPAGCKPVSVVMRIQDKHDFSPLTGHADHGNNLNMKGRAMNSQDRLIGKVTPDTGGGDSIMELAKECSIDVDAIITLPPKLEAFYKTAFNAGIEAAAKFSADRGNPLLADALRALEMK